MLVIGLISGTSVDGIDTALVDITGLGLDLRVKLLAEFTYPYPPELREEILDVCTHKSITMAEFADLDEKIGRCFAESAIAIQKDQPTGVQLIGSHGQNVFHRPTTADQMGYSLQIGRGDLIANLTKITTINNFRVADIAAGGQGAPLVPKIDAYLLGDPHKSRCIQNIGGIANLTYLPPQSRQNWEDQIVGWDTGPGNSLIDLAVTVLSKGEKTYDDGGKWAASGSICQELVDKWLQHAYFKSPPPKSTGRELFGMDYLEECLLDSKDYHLSNEDFLATITELTARSIALNYTHLLPQLPDQVLLCGGGTRNGFLRARLQYHLPQVEILTTDEVGVNSNAKEAIAFAVLAYWRYHGITGNLPSVTGARKSVLLGDIHLVND